MTVGTSESSTTANRSPLSVIVESFLFIIINITAIVGNTFVIVAISRNPALRKITNWYILSLAISDLFVAVTCLPLTLGASIKGQWMYSDVICQIQGHVIQVWACFSLTIVAMTAVNRYYRVVRPVLYRKIFTKRFTMIITASSFAGSALAAVGMIFIMRARFQFGPHFFCTPNFTNQRMKTTVALPVFLAFIIISLLVVIFCYFKVYRVVRRHVILVRPNLTRETFQQRNENKLTCRVDEVNATKMVFAIITVYCLLWIPVCIIGALYVCDIVLPRWTHLMYDYLLFITTATNPLIYGLMNKAFRDEYVRILKCKKST
ncbi:hypothetical protein ACROYT_G031420 [Oculina patagonica]